MTKKYEQLHFEINGQKIPVKIYRERRRNVRASIGKTAAILRLPSLMHKSEQREKITWFYHWLQKQLSKYEGLQEQYVEKNYTDGQVLTVGSRQYLLQIHLEDRKTSSAKLKDGTITLRLNASSKHKDQQKKIQSLLSRIIGRDFLPEIERRIDDYNDRYFKQTIREVKLKNTHSRWGSCTSKGNINLSTRLLFAPDEVIDYVIVHELAHLIEFNHSKKFWSIIEKIIPDYKEKEKWLKVNGPKCRF